MNLNLNWRGASLNERGASLKQSVPGAAAASGTDPVTNSNPTSESVMRVFNIPAITWTLTVFLLVSGSYQVLQAAKSQQRTDQINKCLYALMNALTVTMLWNLAPSTMLAQVAVLAVAALWFFIQAVARPEFKTICAGSHGRLKCAYHGITMAAVALMVAVMGRVTIGENVAPSGTSMPHAQHAMMVQIHGMPSATLDHSPDVAIFLTIVFGVAAVVFTVLLLRFRVPATTLPKTADSKPSVKAEQALEALGAAAMALMFATMSHDGILTAS